MVNGQLCSVSEFYHRDQERPLNAHRNSAGITRVHVDLAVSLIDIDTADIFLYRFSDNHVSTNRLEISEIPPRCRVHVEVHDERTWLHRTQLVLLSLRAQAKVDRLMDRPCCSRVWVCAHICVHVCVWHFPVRECAHMCVYVRCIGSKAAFQSNKSTL